MDLSNITHEELVEAFERFFEAKHCTLFGRAMPTYDADDRKAAAEWYAEVVTRTLSGDYGD